MPTCRNCGGEFDADELVRHEAKRVLVVHCPNCEAPMGRYRRHGDDPATDRRR